jgi:uncharacterized protein (DUF924 family)
MSAPSSRPPISAEQVLEFWFGKGACHVPSPQQLRFWFGGEAVSDQLIRERFAGAVDEAMDGAYQDWDATARGALALILLLDQFPRNIFRHSPRAYAGDARGLALCGQGLSQGQDRQLSFAERAFFYLPLEHAEDLTMQERSVHAFRTLLAEAPAEGREVAESFLDYAIRHRDIIARFGRFPHRNKVLGRPSTPQEEAFLKEPGSSF